MFVCTGHHLCNLVAGFSLSALVSIFARMKFFFFLMGCLIIYLSCLPCGDSRDCDATAAEKISTAGNHQEHQHESESCTPFCTCSCCAISVFYAPLLKTHFAKIIFQTTEYPNYLVAFNKEVYQSIWQPPKIA
jgi:hypothetical protein